MSILVTGGCGFVGTALTQKLIELGENIIVMDLMEPKENNFTFVKGDITCKNDLKLVFGKRNIKAVFHVAGFGLAGTTNLPAFNKQTRKINVEGTLNVIEACLNYNVKALGNKNISNLVKKNSVKYSGDGSVS